MNERNGYIKLHRKMIDWGWYRDKNVKILFIHLLLIANFKESKFEGTIVYPGEAVTSINNLARDTGLTNQNVRTALDKLENSKIITKQPTSRFTRITIKNWALYQGDNLQPTKSLTNEQQTTNKRLTNEQQHHKNDKNDKNDKNKNSVCVNNNYIYKGAREEGYRPHTHAYGEFLNVYLTHAEHKRLCQHYMQSKELIDKVSIWLTNNTRKNHYALCLKFANSDSWPKKKMCNQEEQPFKKTGKVTGMPAHMRKKYKRWSEDDKNM